MTEEILPSRLIVDGASTDEWRVVDMRAREALFEPTVAEVHLLTGEAPDLDGLIGRDATVQLNSEEGMHCVHGVVVEVDETSLRDDRYVVAVTVASKLELLRLGRDHRIYQEKTVQEVVSDVLSRAGIDGICEWSLNASYEAHENIVQYGESDYDFVTRLLFEEGIGFVVEQSDFAERVLFFDDDTAFVALDGESVVPIVHVASAVRHGLSALTEVRQVASDQVMLNDYDLKSPSTDLRTEQAADGSTAREVYVHPGGYTDVGRGQRLTDRLLERLRMRCRTFEGASDLVRLMPGRFLTPSGSARDTLGEDVVLVAVTHTLSSDGGDGVGGATSYSNTFEAIPLETTYRPSAAAPAPVLAGVQHAFVTVPGGEEIHADEFGRTKVRFVWDRSGVTDDKSSTWLRVGQLALGGSMILPRVDFEVLVDFERGDLDIPLVSGHLYNADNPPPYQLPAGCTVSSMQTATTGGGAGANELRFEDAAGSEEILINASKDLIANVGDQTSWNVGANQTRSVGSNDTLSVVANHDVTVTGSRTLSIGANQTVDVGAEYGDGIGGDLSVSIGGNRLVMAGGDHNEDVAAALSRTVGSLQCITGIGGVDRTVAGDSTTTVGAAWVEMCGAARGTSVSGSFTETVGALKFIKAKNVAISCDAAYTMQGAAELYKAGGSRSDEATGAVALTAGGAFKVKAKNIVFEAGSKLVFRGGAASITLTSAGMVTIKAPTIKVKNAKVLNQAVHKSN